MLAARRELLDASSSMRAPRCEGRRVNLIIQVKDFTEGSQNGKWAEISVDIYRAVLSRLELATVVSFNRLSKLLDTVGFVVPFP
jgi:hypothetical protein